MVEHVRPCAYVADCTNPNPRTCMYIHSCLAAVRKAEETKGDVPLHLHIQYTGEPKPRLPFSRRNATRQRSQPEDSVRSQNPKDLFYQRLSSIRNLHAQRHTTISPSKHGEKIASSQTGQEQRSSVQNHCRRSSSSILPLVCYSAVMDCPRDIADS